MPKDVELTGAKPTSIWRKPIAVDGKPLAVALSKAAVEVVTGRWDEAAKNVSEGLSALGLGKKPEELAWTLVYKALLRASFDLIKESAPQLTVPPKGIERVITRVESQLAFHGFQLDATFFERPGEMPLLEQFKKPLVLLLEDFGIKPKIATALVDRLPSYFTFALVAEWRSRPQEYEALRTALDTPFARAAERETSWRQYAAWLVRQVDEPVFDELFGLRQIYIPLRGYYTRKTMPSTSDVDEDRADYKPQRVIVDLSTELEAWLSRADPQDAIRVLSGGPGSGKSSFAKMLAAGLAATSERKVLFIPLHRFELADDLVSAVGEYLAFDQFLTHNPLDPQKGDLNVFVIFDGLDELSMQGRLAAEVAQKFVREVERKTALLNNGGNARFKALIVGRELVIQANASDFRREGQILHVLPYYIDEFNRGNMGGFNRESMNVFTRGDWHDPENLLRIDQRAQWWKKYGTLTGRTYTKLPAALERPELAEVTAQPLLNYLVALSYIRNKPDFWEDLNLNAVYGDLLHAVYERGWAGGRHATVRDIDFHGFVRILEEIALATWHGDGRTTTVREIEEHCTSSGLTQLLGIFQESAKNGVTSLLTAFYFRQRGQQLGGEKTFEFTHKSFGEYLTGLRLVRQIEKTALMLTRRRESVDDGWDERTALAEWIAVCGPTPLDEYILQFVERELRLRDVSSVRIWQVDLDGLLTSLIVHSIPFERVAKPVAFLDQVRWARNISETVLALRSSCARVTGEVSSLDITPRSTFGAWLSWVTGQREATVKPLVLSSLNHLRLDHYYLHARDLIQADLSHSSLQHIGLGYANLFATKLRYCNLRSSGFGAANFDHADLEHADLTGVSIRHSSFRDARLSAVIATGAVFEKCSFRNAQCNNIDFSDSKLMDVDFSNADLTGAQFHGVSAQHVSVADAIISDENRALLTSTQPEEVINASRRQHSPPRRKRK